jgi:hypothetical protein
MFAVTSPRKQDGVVAVLVLVSLIAMLGMVGLALDGGHGMLNKSRLQNVTDAAALASAKVLDFSGGDEMLATDEAMAMFSDNSSESGNGEIAAALAGGSLTVQVQFSATLDPFVPGSTPAEYVRVIATGLDLPGWFIPVMGFDEKRIGASAVAGPSPTLGQVCNVVPMMACGDAAATDGLYGYSAGEVSVLKGGSGGPDEVGPGNFQLVRLDGSAGGADVRDALAGTYDACVTPTDDTIPTEPGNTVGPVAQGLNTRLGLYSGPVSGERDLFPPDLVKDQITPLTYEEETDEIHYDGAPISETNPLPWDYNRYLTQMMNQGAWNLYDEENGKALRRVLRVPVGDCTGTTNGQGDVPLLGVLCFFLMQEVAQKGNEAEVFGQFMGADDTCAVEGRPGPEPVTGPGPYRIQLYKDPDAVSA